MTVGQALAALEDLRAQKCGADAAALLEGALRRDRYEIMRLLAAYETNRDQYVRILAVLRAACVARLAARQIPAALGGRMAELLERSATAAMQNVGLPLLSAVTASRLTDADTK